jgi:hypothetical protein
MMTLLKSPKALLNASLYLIVVYLLSSTYYTNKIKLAISVFILLSFFYTWWIKEKKNIEFRSNIFPLILFGLFVYGLISSGIYIYSNDLTEKEIQWIYNRNILMFINFTFAIAIFYFVITKTYQEIINIIFYVAALNGIVALAQLIYPEFSRSVSGRLTLLSMEPSYAALHYVSVFWLIFYNKSTVVTVNFLAKMFLILGLFIRSKIQLFTIMVTASIYSLKRFVVSVLLMIFIFNFSFLINNLVGKNTQFCKPSTLCDQAYWASEDLRRFSYYIVGNDNSIALKPSYYTRLFSSYYSFKSVNDNLYGIGWGGFNTYFQKYSKISTLELSIIGDMSEYNEIHTGDQESTSKSSLLEIIVSTGLAGIASFFLLLVYMIKHRKVNKGVFLTFLSLVVAGMWIETAPFLALLAITYVLMIKSVNK